MALNATATVACSVIAGPNAGWFEVGWRYLTNNYTEYEIAVYGSLIFHFVVYTLLSLPSIVYPLIPALDKYKLQKEKKPTKMEILECIKNVAFNQFLVEAPMLFVALPLYYTYMGIPFSYDQIPHWTTYVWKILLCVMYEDLHHYVLHRILHIDWLFPLIHKMHHDYTAPFSFTAEYAHPLETIALGAGFFIPALFLCDHIVFLFLWFCVRMLETTDVHSGYDFPFNPLHLVPCYGGARAHDLHHEKFKGNYSSTFTYLDLIFGTAITKESPVVNPSKKKSS